ncbi:isoprene synthase, chloroplastic-like [Amaranthus tricolor]|uniref:isoprene synthase, chloroplastic-like n=1 Tax=Amaranthus tricolor TaxID=29722 RepID=UPI0025852937|nr:isoprene synthase, chloroplastic-like [Amaranthus tricolor]
MANIQNINCALNINYSFIQDKPIPLNSTLSTTNTLSTSPPKLDRRSAGYKPSIWDRDFLVSLRRNRVGAQDESVKIEGLKCKVKNMIADEEYCEPLMVFKLIDEIQRLGLGNHFDKDIKTALKRFSCNFSDLNLDLPTTALGFRLLRQSGFFVSQDVFKQFIDDKGNFIPSLCNENEGIIQLYEASYMAFEGEHILDEAKAFTIEHLANNYMNHALANLPLRYQMPKLKARDHLETYPQGEVTRDVTSLLELAVLDFNNTQLMYQEDLHDMARWWKNVGLSEKLSFARDRLMECFFWGIGTTSSKPELSSCRKALTKVYNFITIIDDIYDVYGHINELHLFTQAIERWNINEIDELPYYMKLTFLALYNTINDIGYEILKLKGYNCVPFLKKAWIDMLKAFLVEANWFHNKETPTFEEYMDNGWVSISGVNALTHAFFYVSPEITPEALQALEIKHDILRLPSMVFRLANDLATSEDEIERGETANAILCYAKDKGVSHKEARKVISKMIDESWKGLNEIQTNNQTPFSKEFIETSMNIARTSQCAYQHGDGHGSPELLKKKILSLVVQPITLLS